MVRGGGRKKTFEQKTKGVVEEIDRNRGGMEGEMCEGRTMTIFPIKIMIMTQETTQSS